MSVTYNKKNKKRARKHGFLKRMSTKSGRNIINARRRKSRTELSVSEE
jgi:large subunit ribosomal protein L34